VLKWRLDRVTAAASPTDKDAAALP
jgi:hypothetical protein